MTTKKEPTVNVTSYFQSGGITANSVNFGRPPRHFDANLATQLEDLLRQHRDLSVRITSVMGDPEAFQFAHEIKVYLEKSGRKVNGVDQALYAEPVIGQSVGFGNGRIDIVVGTNKS